MTTVSLPIRQMYEDYVAGRISYEELRRRIDEAAQEYFTARGQLPTTPPSTQPRRVESS